MISFGIVKFNLMGGWVNFGSNVGDINLCRFRNKNENSVRNWRDFEGCTYDTGSVLEWCLVAFRIACARRRLTEEPNFKAHSASCPNLSLFSLSLSLPFLLLLPPPPPPSIHKKKNNLSKSSLNSLKK